jgi:regulator of sigma E protease
VSWWQAPSEGVKATLRVIKMTAAGIAGLFHDLLWQKHVPSDVAGPVGIAKIVGEVGSQGILPLLELTAVLSVNLALINILPFPALDGGRALFVLIEAAGIRLFKGRREQMAHTVGFALLILLILLITINDIRRIIHP